MHDRVSTADPADALLVVRCQLGEAVAFDALVRRWSGPLHRYATKLAQDPDLAMDLAQEVWLRVIRGIGGLRQPGQFRAWMFGIVHHVFTDRLRARYAMPIDSAVQAEDLAVDDGLDDQALMRCLAEGVDALPLVEREVLVLFHFEGLSLAETAGVLAVPLGTVKSRLSRARALLRQNLVPGDRHEQ